MLLPSLSLHSAVRESVNPWPKYGIDLLVPHGRYSNRQSSFLYLTSIHEENG